MLSPGRSVGGGSLPSHRPSLGFPLIIPRRALTTGAGHTSQLTEPGWGFDLTQDQIRVMLRRNLNVHVARIVLSWSTCCLSVSQQEHPMAWTTPVLVEICIGLEINAYAPAEF